MEKARLTEAEENTLKNFEAKKGFEMTKDESYRHISHAMGSNEFKEELKKLVELTGTDLDIAHAEELRYSLIGLLCFTVVKGAGRDEEICSINMIKNAKIWAYLDEGNFLQYPLILRAMTAVQLIEDTRFPTLIKKLDGLIEEFVRLSGNLHTTHPRTEIVYTLAISLEKYVDLNVRLDAVLDLYRTIVNPKIEEVKH